MNVEDAAREAARLACETGQAWFSLVVSRDQQTAIPAAAFADAAEGRDLMRQPGMRFRRVSGALGYAATTPDGEIVLLQPLTECLYADGQLAEQGDPVRFRDTHEPCFVRVTGIHGMVTVFASGWPRARVVHISTIERSQP